jgi:hypothetical protein
MRDQTKTKWVKLYKDDRPFNAFGIVLELFWFCFSFVADVGTALKPLGGPTRHEVRGSMFK